MISTTQDEQWNAKFVEASDIIKRLPNQPPFKMSDEDKLQFYALYKVSTQGNVTEPRPPFWDPVARAKWDAWNGISNTKSEVAKRLYVEKLIMFLLQCPSTSEVNVENVLQKLQEQKSFEEPYQERSQSRTPVPDLHRNEIFYDTKASPNPEKSKSPSKRLLDISEDEYENPIEMRNAHPFSEEEVNSDVERAFESLQLEVTTLSERVDSLNKALNEKTKLERYRHSWGGFIKRCFQHLFGNVVFIMFIVYFCHKRKYSWATAVVNMASHYLITKLSPRPMVTNKLTP